MRDELETTKQDLDDAAKKHEVFKRHSEQYRETSGALQAEVIVTEKRLADAQWQAAKGKLDADAYQEELVSSRLERNEQQLVHQNLREEFKELKDEFKTLEQPENDLPALARKLRKLRRNQSE